MITTQSTAIFQTNKVKTTQNSN